MFVHTPLNDYSNEKDQKQKTGFIRKESTYPISNEFNNSNYLNPTFQTQIYPFQDNLHFINNNTYLQNTFNLKSHSIGSFQNLPRYDFDYYSEEDSVGNTLRSLDQFMAQRVDELEKVSTLNTNSVFLDSLKENYNQKTSVEPLAKNYTYKNFPQKENIVDFFNKDEEIIKNIEVDEKKLFYEPFEFPKLDSKTTRFFIIKSDNLKNLEISFKNSIWSSSKATNNKLLKSYNNGKNRVFLFFSINGSGKFSGVAEMTSNIKTESVSNNSLITKEKFSQWFNIHWLLFKEIPNRYFRHILIPNNEMKSVTNSKNGLMIESFELGIEMLQIFHRHIDY